MSPRVIAGLNAAGFNTSAALLVDGELVYAVEEERLNREKRTRKFPAQGLLSALKHAGLQIEDVDAFAFSWNPAINLEAPNAALTQRARFLGEFLYSVPMQLMALRRNNEAALTRQTITFLDGRELDAFFITHHLCHASAFFVSPFEEAAILSVDAFGEKHCVMFSKGSGHNLESLWSQDFPHSLGSFYSSMTQYLGFAPQYDEWKLMGASSYGDPRRFDGKLRELFQLKDDAGFEVDLSYFNYHQFHRPGLYTAKLREHLGLAPNETDCPLTQEYYDLAAGVQLVTEEIYFHLLRQLHRKTGLKHAVLSGGVALNCVANGKVTTNTPFEEIFVPPTPDDSGGSAGAAFYLYHHIGGRPRKFALSHNFLGPGFSGEDILRELQKFGIRYTALNDPAAKGAELIAGGKIIGWFQGRLEFGDRALGNRSILADPCDPQMKDRVNLVIKYREPFRPFAPAILEEHVDDYFIGAPSTPFMEKVFLIRPEKRASIPAVTHVDGTGRLQTVGDQQNPLFARLIRSFNAIRGVPIVLNTSFNLKGEPMVCSPQDALRTFYTSGLDALIIGDYLVEK